MAASMQIDKTAAAFHELALTQQQIDEGFIIAAHSKAGSRFKLLLFERTSEGFWEVIAQVMHGLTLAHRFRAMA